MSESTTLGNASFVEPVPRLRRGHMREPPQQGNNNSDQSSERGPLLVAPPTSSEKEKVNHCHSDFYLVYYIKSRSYRET